MAGCLSCVAISLVLFPFSNNPIICNSRLVNDPELITGNLLIILLHVTGCLVTKQTSRQVVTFLWLSNPFIFLPEENGHLLVSVGAFHVSFNPQDGALTIPMRR